MIISTKVHQAVKKRFKGTVRLKYDKKMYLKYRVYVNEVLICAGENWKDVLNKVGKGQDESSLWLAKSNL